MPLLIHTHSYKGQEAFVLDSDPKLLEWLSENFDRLTQSEPEQSAQFTIEDGNLIQSPQHIRIQIEVTTIPDSSRVAREGARFTWYLSREDLERFRDLVSDLRRSETPAHQYLETDDPNAPPLVLSKDEYNDATLIAMNGGVIRSDIGGAPST